MTRSILLAVVVPALALSPVAHAQEKKPIEPGPWKFGATVGLTLSQSAFSGNWSGGDKGSIVWALTSNLTGERQFSRAFHLSNLLQLAYGQTSRQVADPNDPRALVWDRPAKSTDQIVFESTARFSLHSYVDPYLSLRLDSQFKDQSNPVGEIRFNPIKLKEAVGVARVLEKTDDREAITRLGFGFRQTLAQSFINPPGLEKVRFTANDGGIEWQTTVTRPVLDQKVLYKGLLLAYKPLFYSRSRALEEYDALSLAADPTREPVAGFWKATDLNFQNLFSAQITKTLSVNLAVQWVYDRFDAAANVDASLPLAVLDAEIARNVRKSGQFRETLALAVSYRLF